MGLKGIIFKFMSDILKDGSYYRRNLPQPVACQRDFFKSISFFKKSLSLRKYFWALAVYYLQAVVSSIVEPKECIQSTQTHPDSITMSGISVFLLRFHFLSNTFVSISGRTSTIRITHISEPVIAHVVSSFLKILFGF